MKKKNEVRDRSFDFAVRIINLYKYLCSEKKEYVLSKQVLRSGTAIGAMIREAECGESKADFIHKMGVALKEANETGYWLELLNKTEFLTEEQYKSVIGDIDVLIGLLVKIIKKMKGIE
ncbi:MAG: four helix bundle protein [Candidatus Cloacimonetes bacterium]|nr:four helix bundle protein [Candidatus Cloacimonadota bacterium]